MLKGWEIGATMMPFSAALPERERHLLKDFVCGGSNVEDAFTSMG
jgi:hypothetical protein